MKKIIVSIAAAIVAVTTLSACQTSGTGFVRAGYHGDANRPHHEPRETHRNMCADCGHPGHPTPYGG